MPPDTKKPDELARELIAHAGPHEEDFVVVVVVAQKVNKNQVTGMFALGDMYMVMSQPKAGADLLARAHGVVGQESVKTEIAAAEAAAIAEHVPPAKDMN